MISIEHDGCRSFELYEKVDNFAGMKPRKVLVLVQ